MSERIKKLTPRVALPILAGLAVAVGCGDSKPKVATEPNTPFTFDDLGGGDPNIAVYGDPSDTRAGRESAFRKPYRDGKTAVALCRTTGRLVASQVQMGEAYRDPSNQWLQFTNQNGETAYATVIYTNLSAETIQAQEALKNIDICSE